MSARVGRRPVLGLSLIGALLSSTSIALAADAPAAMNPSTATVRSADVSLVKRGKGDFLVGQNGSYTLEVRNSGPSTATGPILITETLPTGLSFVSATGPGWTCAPMGQQVLCTRSGALRSGTTSAVTMTVGVGRSAAPTVANTAVASTGSRDPDPLDNSSSDSTPVRGGQVGDLVYEDADGDGVRDAGEGGLEGVTATLRDAGGAELTDETDADGAYSFDGLPADDYEVDVAAPPGFELTSGEDQRPVRIGSGQRVDDVTFGFERRDASLSGVIFDDADGQGDLDQADRGLEGLTVTLEREDGTFVASTESDQNGAYEFTDLPAREYRVGAARPSGYRSASTPNPRSVSLDSGEEDVSVSVGFASEPAEGSNPVAGDDGAATGRDEAVEIEVLTDDTSPNPGDELELFDFTQPENGEVECTQGGRCTYTPYRGFTGSDSFAYAITDRRGGSDTGTVAVAVDPPANDPPEADDDEAQTSKAAPVLIDVADGDADPDGDGLLVSDFDRPRHGTVGCRPAGTCLYTPEEGYTGTDSFEYTIDDGRRGKDRATVTVSVRAPENRPPTPVADRAQTTPRTPVEIDVVANDSDPDGDGLDVVEWTRPLGGLVKARASRQPSSGRVECTAIGVCTYRPDARFTGVDSFRYTVGDGRGGTGVATVRVAVPAPAPGR